MLALFLAVGDVATWRISLLAAEQKKMSKIIYSVAALHNHGPRKNKCPRADL